MACRPLPEETPALSLADALVEFLTEIGVSQGKQHAAALMIAKRQADQFLRRHGGGRFRVPMRVNYTRDATKAKRDLARQMLVDGTPPEVIVQTLKISRRTLYRLQGKKG